MTTSGNIFDAILQEVMKQKQLLEELISENQSLHQELSDLRNGQGIFIDIEGQRFALKQNQSSVSGDLFQAMSRQEPPGPYGPPSPEDIEGSLKVSPLLHSQPLQETSNKPVKDTNLVSFEESGESSSSSFLEEIMLDEFSKVATNPITTIKPSRALKSTARIEAIHAEVAEEEEKAELRKALTGSFLLE